MQRIRDSRLNISISELSTTRKFKDSPLQLILEIFRNLVVIFGLVGCNILFLLENQLSQCLKKCCWLSNFPLFLLTVSFFHPVCVVLCPLFISLCLTWLSSLSLNTPRVSRPSVNYIREVNSQVVSPNAARSILLRATNNSYSLVFNRCSLFRGRWERGNIDSDCPKVRFCQLCGPLPPNLFVILPAGVGRKYTRVSNLAAPTSLRELPVSTWLPRCTKRKQNAPTRRNRTSLPIAANLFLYEPTVIYSSELRW